MNSNLPEMRELLSSLGLSEIQRDNFFDHVAVVYPLRTQSEPGIGLIHFVNGKRLRNGIIEIQDRGNGLRTFGQFRTRTLDLAKYLSLSEVELFGAAVINPKLEGVLSRSGLERQVEAIPEELGNEGVMETYSKILPVPGMRVNSDG